MLDILAIFAAEAAVAAEAAAIAEAAAVAEAAATAAAAAETAAATTAAAQAATATEAATGIMQAAPAAETAALQASPELMQSVANFTPETSMFSPQSTQLAGSMPADASTALNPLPQTPAMQSPMAPGIDSLGTQPESYGTSFTPNQSVSPNGSLGTQPGGPYDTSSLSNANDVPNTRLDAWQAKYDAPGGTDSSFMKGFNAVSDWADKNPFKAAGLGYMAYSALNKPEPYKSTPYDGPLSKFRISPDFQGRQANPQDFQYTPRQYASGGITDIQSYAKGKLTEDNVDVGIFRDTDPDTANLDPLTAAMLRQSKLDKRSYVNTKAKFNKPTPMGTLNFNPVVGAAQGGIMQTQRYDEGGVTGGGNIDLHIPVNIGGGGGGGGGGKYDGFGGGFGGGGGGNGFGGLDPNAIAADPQGFQRWNQQRQQQGGMGGGGLGGILGGLGQMFGGMMGGSQGGFGQSNQMNMNYGMGNDSMRNASNAAIGPGNMYNNMSMIENTNQGINPNADMKYSAFAGGGAVPGYDLGGYAAGGNPRLLRGPGDGMSDNIPATINNRQPARLADGEFVVPADVVSHLGNGSTEAGAKKLHEMMNHVRKARTGNPKQGKQINPNKYMPK
jgi:hypothetical protein